MSVYIEKAYLADAQAITNLVNMAYRPEAGRQGWTHEIGLVSGARITVEQVAALLDSRSTILVMRNDDRILACVQIEPSDNQSCYISMLATAPEAQGNGIGKQMLAAAESLAVAEYSACVFKMSVLSPRQELLAYYKRRGYVLSGYSEHYPVAAEVGIPMIAGLQLLGLEKQRT
ncbi:hypothetical protein Z042_06025 [Chania multitudinisentens RB-25]|uniref:N-acetyltransferase domain-containing protein n=1 Tax=Chania multitudinisentens RB-25 TaxID=1441930 RepID=W0L5Y8_9GAMM|nr:GNAT family N-acetyltransferase [Chania multitudinisentens]AHG19223.1 hypothetical protein Z042_06025 [Chania multitudinisentens RB-25]